MSLTPAWAIFGAPGDETSLYRYVLSRRWAPGPTMAIIGVNPSTATATTDDPTIRRCIGFARDSGHGALVMLNLFAWRSKDVHELADAPYPVGEQNGLNEGHVLRECLAASTVVCAWGVPEKLHEGLRFVWCDYVRLLRPKVVLHALAVTKDGHPKHPLYLSKTCRPQPWTPP